MEDITCIEQKVGSVPHSFRVVFKDFHLASQRSFPPSLWHVLLWDLSWVEGTWISILTLVVLGVEVGNNGLSDSDKVINVLQVGEVLVEVILEVLEHVHVGLDNVVSSHSWEGEGGIVELPGVDLWWGRSELGGDEHGVLVVLDVEFSRELVHLPLELRWVNPESWLAFWLWWGEGVNDTIIHFPSLPAGLDVGNILDTGGIELGERLRLVSFSN